MTCYCGQPTHRFATGRANKYCSMKCKDNRARIRKANKEVSVDCGHCGKQFTKMITGRSKVRGEFCDRVCGFAHTQANQAQVAYINKWARRNNSALHKAMKRLAITRNALASRKPRPCKLCKRGHYRKSQMTCSPECTLILRTNARESAKQTESYRKSRRESKLRRKARMRGAIVSERIDPVKVFDRGGWICKLCLVPTPREICWRTEGQ